MDLQARVAGARAATGDTLTFLDSHISCSIGWLEPMMYRIKQDRRHVVMPKIDGVIQLIVNSQVLTYFLVRLIETSITNRAALNS